MSANNSNRAYFMSLKWEDLAQTTAYMGEQLDLRLYEAGVRDRHDTPGDRLGDSPEASMVRVHARAALGALEHLSASLKTVADALDAQTKQD